MATTRGTWGLDEAIGSHWRLKGLDQAFKREWVERGSTEYETLHDGYASPSQPGPYCVYEKWEPEIVANMSGADDTGEENQVVRWTFQFNIHTRDRGHESAKEIAVRLAKKVVAAFDPHNAVSIDGSVHIETERGPDWYSQEGEREGVWTLEYRFYVDATLKISVFEEEEESSQTVSQSSWSTPTSQSSMSSLSTSCSLPEDDDVLDFGDIGGVYDSAAAAVANTAALAAYLASRVNDSVALKFGGPRDYDTKRQPGVAHLDLSGGSVAINLGGSGRLTDIWLEGPSKIVGVNAATAVTPVFTITRYSATSVPQIVLENMVLQSNGSGLKIVAGGSGLRIESLKIDNFTGAGVIDYDTFDDVDAETCSYGLWIEDADYGVVRNLQVEDGAGHGVVITRMHAGEIQARVRSVDGDGYKIQQCNQVHGQWFAESCKGFGLHCRDTGMDRRSGGVKVANDGAPNDWHCWFEANNGRGTPYTSTGYAFSQFRFDNVARVRMTGHSGWRDNLARVDRISRLRNVFLEQINTDLSVDPAVELVTSNLVSANVTLPGAGGAETDNWSTIWTNPIYRPTASIVGAGTAEDPERVRIVWPADSFDNVAVIDTAYWRPFGNLLPQVSPASFVYTAQVKAVDSAIGNYAAAREAAGATRQGPWIGAFSIDPVSGAITGVTLWDTYSRWFSGEFDIDDVFSNVGPAFNAWYSGMQDQTGAGLQSQALTLDLLQLRMYRLT